MRAALAFLAATLLPLVALAQQRFDGQHYRGVGDVEHLEMLDISARMFEPDPEFLNVAMLYEPKWNGLVEGPTWDAWWIQNSYGTTVNWLPFTREPFTTFLQNAQDLWFRAQGDGKTPDTNGYVAPDGCLVDAASLDKRYARQGDGQHAIHDWGMEFTAAGVVMQAELLLISRDEGAIGKYLPHLERAAHFIETRRDEQTGLFLGGPACNLLAPSFGGYLKPDGTRGMAFHAGLQVTYIAALDRLIEVEKLAGREEQATLYTNRRDRAKASLPKLLTEEGYFVNSIDPDGTKHGVYGAAKHGYFESSVNHDAIAFRVADDALARRIMAKFDEIPQLRPHGFVIPNYPAYDDMYHPQEGIWAFGHWVNGGHWSTCEGRMILAYHRMAKFEEAKRSMRQLMKFARAFRMDNPLVDFGNNVYQPNQPINITYDAFAVPAAMRRGLFEYLYNADRLVLVPHVPPGIMDLQQLDPIRFGTKRVFLRTVGTGPVTGVEVNGQAWDGFSQTEVTLTYDRTPERAEVVVLLGGAGRPESVSAPLAGGAFEFPERVLADRSDRASAFQQRMMDAGLGESYEAQHAGLIAETIDQIACRQAMLADGRLKPLPEASRAAADQLCLDTANKLFDGLETLIKSYADSSDATRRQICGLWMAESR